MAARAQGGVARAAMGTVASVRARRWLVGSGSAPQGEVGARGLALGGELSAQVARLSAQVPESEQKCTDLLQQLW